MECFMRLRIPYVASLVLLFAVSSYAETPVTFNKEIIRLFQDNCQNCHRPGNIAPFSLLSYEEARRHAFEIRQAVQSREMPPWKPVGSHGVFEDERYLTDEQIQTIGKWVDDGILEGDPKDLPPPINFPETWTAGTPEIALQYSQPYPIAPAEKDIYRCFPIDLNTSSDVWVRGYEVLPGNRKVVHHVILFTDSSGASIPLDDADPGPGYTCFGGAGFGNGLGGFGGWAPGAAAQMFPGGSGVLLKAGTRVVMQVHYSVSEITDPSTPLDPVTILPVINTRFVIPPNNSHYRVSAILPLISEVELLSIAPHMHLLGKQVTVEAIMPFLQRKQLIRIDDWSFHWQGIYNYKQSIKLPAGTLLVMTAYFDNSVNNPENPHNPPVSVRFGEQTDDEMCIAFLLVKGFGGRAGTPDR